MSKELYQNIYETESWYGNAEIDRCPGFRLLPKYKDFLESPVVELGCGRGSVVEKLRSLGYECDGYDQVSINPNMNIADITKDMDITANSIVCIDVIEHIYDKDLKGLWQNFKKAKKQVFSIFNAPDIYKGQNLHVNLKTFPQWEQVILNEGFTIKDTIRIHDKQMLYFTTYE